MVILVLGACPDVDLDVRRSFRLELAKVRKLKVWKVEKFDGELTLLISGRHFGSGIWNSSVVSIMTCVQNSRSIERDLIGFGISFRS